MAILRDQGWLGRHCSACGAKVATQEHNGELPKRCPFCGMEFKEEKRDASKRNVMRRFGQARRVSSDLGQGLQHSTFAPPVRLSARRKPSGPW